MRDRTYARDLPDLRTGVYRHWKGHFYLVSGYAHDANIEGRIVVTYIGLELDDANLGPRPAVRDVDDFFRLVCSKHGNDWSEVCPGETSPGIRDCDGGPVQRFEYAGPSWYGWPRSAVPAPSLPDELATAGVPDAQPGQAWLPCPVAEPHEPHGPCPGMPARFSPVRTI